MSGVLEQFHFLRPWWLLALPVFWLLVWRFLRGRHQGGAWARICDEALLPFVMTTRESPSHRAAATATVLGGTLAILAAAGPTWERLPVPVFRGESALVVALDLSASMNAADVTPSRLERARYRVADLLRLRRAGQTAMVVYAAQSFVVTPLTDDTQTLAAQLQVLDTGIMPSQGSEPGSAIEQAERLLAQAGVPRGHVLLITDGASDEALARARDAAGDSPHRLSVLGVGTPDGAPVPDRSGGFMKNAAGEIVVSTLEEDALRALASAGRGLYFDVGASDAELARLNDLLEADLDAGVQRLEALASEQWREIGPWLLLPLLPLAALGFRRGVLVVVLAASLTLGVRPAMAGWFQRDDQAAEAAFERGEYAEAARRFDRQAWQAAAHYRAGAFEEAAAALEPLDTTDAHYNRGNALARLGRLQEAIAAYDAALEQAGDHADAAHNKALLEKLLEQEQPPEQRGQNDEQDEDGQSQGSQAADERGSEQSGESSAEPSASDEANARQEHQSDDSQAAGEDVAEDVPEAAAEREAEGAEENDAGEQDETQLAEARNESDAERAQATEQWLRQIPDDPGGLLRRKFEYQYKRQYGDTPYRGDAW